MDIISVSSIIVSSLTAIGVILHQLHLRNCSCLCVNSNCYKSPPSTPTIIHDIVREPRPHKPHTETSEV
jgi:hypothetical protein